jgi:hypothetical protein
MQVGGLFFCSQLMKVSQGRKASIGNMETIRSDACTITMDVPLSVGTQVTIRCLGCGKGKKSCTDCKFKGRVRSHEDDPGLGFLIQIEFEGSIWSPEKWHPEHLTEMKPIARSASS